MPVHRYAPPFVGLLLLAAAGLIAWLMLRPAPGPLPSPAAPVAAVPAPAPAPAEQASAPAEHPISEVAARVAAASDAESIGLPEA
jgi:hypothetical protein